MHKINKMQKSISIIVLFIFLSARVSAIEGLHHAALFYEKNEKQLIPYIEIITEINPKTVGFVKTKLGHWQQQVIIQIDAKADTGWTRLKTYILKGMESDSMQVAPLFDLNRVYTPIKTSACRIVLTDKSNLQNVQFWEDSIQIDIYNQTQVHLSSIQIIDKQGPFDSTLQEPVFLKNGLYQIPSSSLFLENVKVVNCYAESYQLQNKDTIMYQFYISKKAFGEAINHLIYFDTLFGEGVFAHQKTFPIHQLKSGNYFLNLIANTKENVVLTKQNCFFQILNTAPIELAINKEDTTKEEKLPTTFLNLATTFIAKYNTAQLKAILKMIAPVSSAIEKAQIKQFLSEPNDTYMRYFLYNYWEQRNKTNPAQAWNEYAEKIKIVNKLYTRAGKIGYETDMGITYLKYGAPNEQISVQNETGALPYTIWQYNTIGKRNIQGLFLFYIPPFALNEYLLLHSNVIGDVFDPNWRASLYTSGQSPIGDNSRALQYFNRK